MRGCKLAMVRNLALPLYGRTQKSGLAEVIPLICISLSGANSLCFHTISFLRALHGVWLQSDSCAWLILWFLPEFPEVSLTQLTGSCNHWWLWHPLFTDTAGNVLSLNGKPLRGKIRDEGRDSSSIDLIRFLLKAGQGDQIITLGMRNLIRYQSGIGGQLLRVGDFG